MKNLLSSLLSPSKKEIVNQMNEPRPLPLGRKEFEQWSDRIIGGALVVGASIESQKATLAGCIMHLGPTESHKPDAFFIHSLRKLAANQVAHAMFSEYQKIEKDRLVELEKQQGSTSTNETKVLEKPIV